MTTQEIVRASLSAITASGLDYVVVGAFATGHYAFPRATKDADFVVAAPLAAIGLIAPHFPASFHVDPQPQMEMLTGTYQWIVEVDGTEFRVEIFHLGGDPHHELIFRRRVELEMPEFGGKVWLPTAEDLVIQKLRWGPGERFRRRAQYSRRAKRSDRLRAHRDVVRAPRDWNGWRKCAREFRRGCERTQPGKRPAGGSARPGKTVLSSVVGKVTRSMRW